MYSCRTRMSRVLDKRERLAFVGYIMYVRGSQKSAVGAGLTRVDVVPRQTIGGGGVTRQRFMLGSIRILWEK